MGEIGNPQRKIEVIPKTKPVRHSPVEPARPAPVKEPVPV